MLRFAPASAAQAESPINATEPMELGLPRRLAHLVRLLHLVMHAVYRFPSFATDSAITLIAMASMIWGARASQDADHAHWPWWVWLLAVLVALPLQGRRRFPFSVWLAVGLLIIVFSILNGSAANWNHCDEFALLVAMTTVAYLGTKPQFYISLTLSIAGTAVVAEVADTGNGSLAKNLISLLITLLAFVAGRLGAKQREYASVMAERANQVEQTAAARAAEAAAEERTRIARDMHDIVAHAVSLMVVQAEAGASVLHNSPDRAERAFDSIADTGREALAQLRRVLGVLRDGDALALLAPQPTVAALPSLIASVRGTGLEVALHAEGESRHLQADVEVAIYRTVQEALTNAVKHAQASRAEVRLAWGSNTLTVTIADNGRGLRRPEAKRTAGTTGPINEGGATDSASVGDTLLAAVPIPGRGLIGINERIGACAGAVTTGPGLDGGGFAISAVVPIQDAPARIAAPRGPEGRDEPAR
jgi:signal transduction histidine kinase